MTRAQRAHLAGILRGLHAELKAAPADARKRAAEHQAELGPAGSIIGPEPFALGSLEARIERIAAELDATVVVYLEPRRRRS